MERMTAEEVAATAGVSPDRVAELVRLGLLVPADDGSYLRAAVETVRVAEALERGGTSLADVGRAIAGGKLSLSFMALLTEAPPPTGVTYEEACRGIGIQFSAIQQMFIALGIPLPEPEDRVPEDLFQVFPTIQLAVSIGVEPSTLARASRSLGEAMSRVAEANRANWHAFVEQPLLASGMTDAQMLEVTSAISPQIRAAFEQMMIATYRRHHEREIFAEVVDHVEAALEHIGIAPVPPARPPGMVFLDLVGYTRLTEEQGDRAAAELAASLGEVVTRESRDHGGKPVKWLGDGVMLHFADPGGAVRCSLDLVDRVPRAGLPPAHVGVSSGPVIVQDGDYFGRTVNLAARIAGRAEANEVLASEDVVAAVPDGVAFEEVGPVELRGISRPVTIYRAERRR
jgi:class 3 adenylate cyclase